MTSWELMIYQYLITRETSFTFPPYIKKLRKGELILAFNGLNKAIEFRITKDGTQGQFEYFLNDELFDIQFGGMKYMKILMAILGDVTFVKMARSIQAVKIFGLLT